MKNIIRKTTVMLLAIVMILSIAAITSCSKADKNMGSAPGMMENGYGGMSPDYDGKGNTVLEGENRKIIKNVKSCLHIPLIANGDVVDAESALAMMRDTEADGIAIGRGAVGNPFIFEEIAAAIEGAPYSPPSLDERCEAALLQLKVAIEEKGERVAVNEARKQIAMFLRAFRGAARIRAQINRAESYEEVKRALFDGIKEQG